MLHTQFEMMSLSLPFSTYFQKMERYTTALLLLLISPWQLSLLVPAHLLRRSVVLEQHTLQPGIVGEGFIPRSTVDCSG